MSSDDDSRAVHIQFGVPVQLRDAAAVLYDEAFGPKLALAIPDTARRQRLLSAALDLPFAVVALAGDELVGLAGFHNAEGSLTGGMTAGGLLRLLGFLGGARAVVVLSLYERQPEEGELLMDGIAVRSDQRGRGIGTMLLGALKQYAREEGYAQIRLDVIDTNTAARRLYEREGFVETDHEGFEYLRGVLGFGGSTTMVWQVE